MDLTNDDHVLSLEARPMPDVLCRELTGESVLLDLKSQRYYGLDEIGTRIWQLLGKGEQAGQVVGAMLEEFEVEEAQLRLELSDFLRELSDAGLVELLNPPAEVE